MSWLVSAKQYIPAVIGEPWGGGYFAGYISHTADGNPTHALIVAPVASGATGGGYPTGDSLAFKVSDTTTANTTSTFDGAANTAAMVTAGIADHPAAQFCVGLTVGGFTDWYLPSRYELDIAYFNLKPTTASNNTGTGQNLYSVPSRSLNYTSSYPARTPISLFQGAQAFAAVQHWSSTENAPSNAIRLDLSTGQVNGVSKLTLNRVRAFRRIAL